MSESQLPTLTGDRICLRWMTDKDIPALFRVFSEGRVTRYWSSPPLESMEGASSLLTEIHQYFESGSLYQWGIASIENDSVIGTCTLAGIDRTHLRCEIGFALHPDHWGRGLAEEAVTLAVGWAIRELGMNRIEADIDPRNDASIRLVEKLGFRREGLLRERYHVNGEVQDSVIYGLLRREFDSKNA